MINVGFTQKTIKRCENCTACNIEYLQQHNEKKMALIFLETERAFENLVFYVQNFGIWTLGRILLKG